MIEMQMSATSDMGASDVEHVNFAFSNSEQHAIAAHIHLPNFFVELFVFWGKRKTFRQET